MYDLDALKPDPGGDLLFPTGHYPKSIAAVNGTILAASPDPSASRSGSAASSTPTPAASPEFVGCWQEHPDRCGPVCATQAFTLPSLGIYQNCVSTSGPCPYNTILTPSPDGRLVLAALSDGNVFLYSDALHTFTTSRKDFTSFSGAYAASNNGQYVVGNNLLKFIPCADQATRRRDRHGFRFRFCEQHRIPHHKRR